MNMRIITIIGTLASLVGLIFAIRRPDQPLNVLQGILLAGAICFFIIAVILEIKYYKQRPLYLKKESQIRDYMHKWISRGGIAAIFSHDMSWVKDQEMIELLRSKARRSELCIYLPVRIPLADELEREGAQIFVYPELNYIPQSRFTVINQGRWDAQVAVGRAVKDKHMIEEFSAGEHPVFSVANDLMEIIMRFYRSRNANR